jgi:hypothetical protein
MKQTLFTAILLSFVLGLSAQIQHRCAYDHAVQYKDEMHPGFKASADQIFRQAQQVAAQYRGGGNYIIPLAFHVVWKNPAEKLAECKVLEQVNILNRAFQRLNPDTVNLRSIFSSVAANPGIEFRLDTIIWVETDSQFFSGGFLPDIGFSDRVKHSGSGGSDAIATTGHLNIWACNLGSSGILGYAYPPAGLTNWPANSQAPTPGDDGVVLDYRIVGAEGLYVQQGTSIASKGNAAVHEVGHYLGLRHIWGDGLLAILGFPDCNADDGVADTPNSGVPSNYECNLTQNTCGAGTAGDLPDMIENFMDYSDENCQNTYTAGQVAIMHGVLNSERSGLANTAPIHNTTRPDNDALPNAFSVGINNDNSCAISVNGSNTGASPSMSVCNGTTANDVWYSFQAQSSDVIVNISNVQATSGSSTNLIYEIFGGDCDSLQSLGCYNTLVNSISALQYNATYYLRVYSLDPSAAQSYNLCLQAAGNVAVTDTELVNEVKIYPNPGNGILNISLPENTVKNGSLCVRNVLGQQIGNSIKLEQSEVNMQLNLSELANGIYFLEFHVNNLSFSKKVIIQR